MLDVTLTPDDGDPIALHIDMRDVYRWEMRSKGKKSMPDLERTSATDLYELAYLAAKRKGQFDGSLAEFVDLYAIDKVDDEPAPDPTQPEA